LLVFNLQLLLTNMIEYLWIWFFLCQVSWVFLFE